MASSYVYDLSDGQQIVVESRGSQTLVTQASARSGQQQSQGSGFDTGAWTMPPVLLRTATDLVLRVEGAQGTFFIGLQGHQTGLLRTPPSLADAEVLPLRQATRSTTSAATEPLEPFKRMEPLKPMKPMKSMQMRMGAMQMQMGMGDQEQEDERYCGQCGHAAAEGDRFCTRCGHRLT